MDVVTEQLNTFGVKRTKRRTVRPWVLLALRGSVLPGLVLSVAIAERCYFGSGPYSGPGQPRLGAIQLADRGGWWLDLGVSNVALSTLIALAAFAWASLQVAQKHLKLVLVLRRLGAAGAALMGALQTGGVLMVGMGEISRRLGDSRLPSPWSAFTDHWSAVATAVALVGFAGIISWSLLSSNGEGEETIPDSSFRSPRVQTGDGDGGVAPGSDDELLFGRRSPGSGPRSQAPTSGR